MSNFNCKVKIIATGEIKDVYAQDNFFGHHQYGYSDGEKTYHEEEVEIIPNQPTNEEKKCEKCGKEGADEITCMCQECWEDHADKEWWKAVTGNEEKKIEPKIEKIVDERIKLETACIELINTYENRIMGDQLNSKEIAKLWEIIDKLNNPMIISSSNK